MNNCALYYQLRFTGSIQGIGFRPMVCRVAEKLGIKGEIENRQADVIIRFVASEQLANLFSQEIQLECPQAGHIENAELVALSTGELPAYPDFRIVRNANHNANQAMVSSINSVTPVHLPVDKAMCATCISEANIHLSEPFRACCDCGPRFTILKRMPYTRSNTAMNAFALCPQCRREFDDLNQRRAHFEGICCAQCQPDLWCTDAQGKRLCDAAHAIDFAVNAIAQGKMLAIKGIGGFHLACDALNHQSIAELRMRKHRPDKPLAVMFRDIAQLQDYYQLNTQEEAILTSPQAPIVLLEKARFKRLLPDKLSPQNHSIGVMLAYSPLHYLLLKKSINPLVMTSGNASGSPICHSNEQALASLSGIADHFVLHNREIEHPLDDSVVQIISGKPRLIRRARGYVPQDISVHLSGKIEKPHQILALGGDLKNSFALMIMPSKQKEPKQEPKQEHESENENENRADVVLSGFNGDLGNLECFHSFKTQIQQYCELFAFAPTAIAVDAHPDYLSSRYGEQLAQELAIPLIQVQHHHAHMASCLAEHQISPKQDVFALCLDGLGFGYDEQGKGATNDSQIWGCELLYGNAGSVQRLGSLKPYPLLGGDKANTQPCRNLVALLAELENGELINASQQRTVLLTQVLSQYSPEIISQIEQLWQLADYQYTNSVNLCSSAGRLFDAAACLLGVAPAQISYEGQAAQALENLAQQGDILYRLPCSTTLSFDGMWRLNVHTLFKCMLQELLENSNSEQIRANIALGFHQCLSDGLISMVNHAFNALSSKSALSKTIVLTGGCMQNRILCEGMQQSLVDMKWQVLSHQAVPCNDGGLALGQCLVASSQLSRRGI